MSSAETSRGDRGAKLVVATGNPHKVQEIRDILVDDFTADQLEGVVPLSNFDAPEPVEDGITFVANALIKARSAAQATGLPALADDSGITVSVLGGAPGVFSARWSGTHGDDVKNRRLLLEQVASVPDEYRQAAFVAAIAIVWPDGREIVAEGAARGMLLREESGEGGFGYDPIFVPDGHQRTTAQMTPAEKNAISHRGNALRKLTEPLREILGSNAGK